MEQDTNSRKSASKGGDPTGDFEVVVDFDSEDWWIAYDTTYGLYCRYSGEWWTDDELELEHTEWRHEFEQRGFYDGRKDPYLIYNRPGTYTQDTVSGEKSYCSHIVQGGETICHIDASIPVPDTVVGEKSNGVLSREIPHPTFELITPVDQVGPDWGESDTFCEHCMRLSRQKGILPGHNKPE